jgi:hypothetical protein
MARQKKNVDWVKLEADYRANIKSMRVLASEYRISTARIGQVAEENGWTRDIAAKVKAKAQAKLDASLLDGKLDVKKATEKEVIEVAAETQKNIILGHRTDIARARKLVMSLLNELEGESADPDLLSRLGELIQSKVEDEAGQKVADKMMDAFRKASSLPGRVGTMKALAEAMKNLIPMEREAFGLESKNPLGDLSDAVKNMTVSFVSAQKPQS